MADVGNNREFFPITITTVGIVVAIIAHVVGVAGVLFVAQYRISAIERRADKVESKLDAREWEGYAVRNLQNRVAKLENQK